MSRLEMWKASRPRQTAKGAKSRGWGLKGGVPSLVAVGSKEELCPQIIFCSFNVEMMHFGIFIQEILHAQ